MLSPLLTSRVSTAALYSAACRRLLPVSVAAAASPLRLAHAVPATFQLPRELPDVAPTPTLRSGNSSATKCHLVSLDDSRAMASIAVLLPCGSRYESVDDRTVGAAGLFASSFFMSKVNISSEYLVCEPLVRGVSVSCKSTRDHIIYSASFPRDQAQFVLAYLYQNVNADVFKRFRLEMCYELMTDRSKAHWANPHNAAIEHAYALAFRKSSLGYFSTGHPEIPSLYFPAVKDFISKNAIFDERASIAAVGLSHAELNNSVSSALKGISVGSSQAASTKLAPPKYYGGSQRIAMSAAENVILFAAPGASISDVDSRAALSVLAALVAPCDPVKHYYDEKIIVSPRVYAHNAAHTDTGLFFLRASAPYAEPDAAVAACKRALGVLRNAARGKIDSSALSSAKLRAFIDYYTNIDSREAKALELAYSKLCGVEDGFAKKIGKIEESAVIAAAKKLISYNPSYVVAGNIFSLPYVEDLAASE